MHPDVDFTTNNRLIDDQILDSFDIITLITEISEEFDVRIPVDQIVPENFNSLTALFGLIERLMD